LISPLLTHDSQLFTMVCILALWIQLLRLEIPIATTLRETSVMHGCVS
jgi:hypothetical protein